MPIQITSVWPTEFHAKPNAKYLSKAQFLGDLDTILYNTQTRFKIRKIISVISSQPQYQKQDGLVLQKNA